jgi:hypothetical protein
MSESFRCVRGHDWSTEPGKPIEHSTNPSCPVCGSESQTIPPHAEQTGADAEGVQGPDELPEIPGYTIQERLGEGGMGVVYRATHDPLGRIVAVKIIRAGEHAGRQDLQRFQAEAEMIARLQHPNIVPIYELGRCRGQPYFTLEYVRGGTLKKRLAAGPLPPRDAAQLMVKLARATAYALAQGVVHRDLKPDNVLMTEEGEPKIADYGVAKRLAGGAGLTQSGAVVGTPAYIAPEQAAGSKDVGPAADIYALGAVLYECLTGRPPFEGESLYDTLHKVLTEDPVSPAWFRPGLPRDLETICLKCLRKKPEQRYATAEELAEDLERYLAHRPIHARRTAAWEKGLKWGRRHPTAATLLTLLTCLLVVAAVFGWSYYDRVLRVHVAYYANFGKRWGAYEGIGLLTDEQVQNRLYSYKFYTRAGRVERMDAVDHQGRLTNEHPVIQYMDTLESAKPTVKRECYYKLVYDSQGQVTDEISYDRRDHVVFHFHYTSTTTAAFTDGEGLPLSRTPSGATYVELTRNSDGLETELHYRGGENGNEPRPDEDGAYGWRMEYGALDLPTSVTFLDAGGRPFRNRNGYATIQYEHDALGNVTKMSYLDEKGRQTRHKDGYAALRQDWDEYGRLDEQTFLDEHDESVRSRSGIVQCRWTYTSPTDYLQEYFDERGQPDRPLEPYAPLRQETIRSDPSGRTVKVTYLDEAGQPMRDAYWVAAFIAVTDADGRVLDLSYFGPDGRPTFLSEGYGRKVMRYDDDGNMTLWEGYDLDGRLTRNDEWYARMVCKYDNRGHCTEKAYYGPDGEPTLHKNGYAVRVANYDANGNLAREEFLDTQRKPVRCRGRYYRARYGYDSGGHNTEIKYFAPDETPTWHKKGYASLRMTYDPRGFLLTRTALSPDTELAVDWDNRTHAAKEGQPAVDWNGTSRIRYDYDNWGNTSKEGYYSPDGKRPRLNAEGAAVVERVFDRRGNELSVSYFGRQGEKLRCKAGYWQEQIEYNDRGFVTRRTYHDIDGARIATAENIAEERVTPDRQGRAADVSYLGVDGKPALKGGLYARVITDYDDRGLIVGTSYYGLDGKQLVNGDEGFARSRTDFDARGRMTARHYFGTDGKPGRHNAGNAQVQWAYDDRGHWIAESYFDAGGEPLALGGRYAKQEYAYNDRGNQTEILCRDREGKLVAGPFGYARVMKTYDDRDNVTSCRFLGPDNQPCLHSEGNAKVIRRYNDCDEGEEEAFYGLDDRLLFVPKYGYARRVYVYDDLGNLKEQRYYGADDKPINGPDGYARRVFTLEGHDVRETKYYDREDHALPLSVVVTKVEPGKVGDRMGLKVGDVFTHYDGKTVTDRAGFIKTRAAELPGGPTRTLQILRDGKELEFQVSPGLMHITLDDLPRAQTPAKK